MTSFARLSSNPQNQAISEMGEVFQETKQMLSMKESQSQSLILPLGNIHHNLSGQKFRHLDKGEIDLKNDVRVSFQIQACNQNVELNTLQSQTLSDRIIVAPKVQQLDEKLQFSVEFQFGNQKQSINFDINIHNQFQEKFCDQISSGQICSCKQSQSQLTHSKLQEFEDQYSSSCQYGLIRAKLRKGSCNSDLSDATLINEPNNPLPYGFTQVCSHFLEERQEEFMQPANLYQKFQNFDNCKSELPEQKSHLKTNNKKKQQQQINQVSNIYHNHIQSATQYQIQESANQKLKQFITQENPKEEASQTDKKLREINSKFDGSLNNECSVNPSYNQNHNKDQVFFTKDEMQNILGNYFDLNILETSSSLPQSYKQNTSRVNEIQSVLKTPIKNEIGNYYKQSQTIIEEKFEEAQEENMSDNLKFNKLELEQNESELQFGDKDNELEISYTKEYLAKAEKKNVVKNFVKAFKSYLSDDESRSQIMELLSMKTTKELEQLKQKFQSYLKKKKFNNKLIKDLLISQSYSKVFEFWLLNSAKDWLYSHSKVENKDSHNIMLNYFIQCIEQPDMLDKLKVLKSTKRQLTPSPSSLILLSTPLEQNKFNQHQMQHLQQSMNSNQNTYNQLDSEQQFVMQKSRTFEPISISTFTVLPISNSQQLSQNEVQI